MFTSYCERLQQTSQRRKTLKEVYGFDCTCTTCQRDPVTRKESDLARVICQLIDDWIPKERDLRTTLIGIHLRLRLLCEEGLAGPDVARTLNDAVQVCVIAGEFILASCYARLAVDAYRMGGNSEVAEEQEKWSKHPQSYPSAAKVAVDQLHGSLALGGGGLQAQDLLDALEANLQGRVREEAELEEKFRKEAQKRWTAS